MDKYAINYAELKSNIDRPKYYKYEDVKHRLIRVAYDVVKFQDANEDIDGLWQIQTTNDGEVIVAMYDAPESQATESIKTESSWAVIPDQNNASMNVFYKGNAIHRIASAQIGVPSQDLPDFCVNVAAKLDANEDFRRSLLEDIPVNERMAIFSKYPELTK